MKLHLSLKREYFDAIKDGTKPEEYREVTDYWTKRLVGKTYDGSAAVAEGFPIRDGRGGRAKKQVESVSNSLGYYAFAGTGTTGEAAWREGLKAILIEREPAYLDDIAERMRLCRANEGAAAEVVTPGAASQQFALRLDNAFSGREGGEA